MASGTLNPVRPQTTRTAPAEEAPGDAELLRRFARGRDDAAFTTLVRRHGPMVLGVCRRVLKRPHDAEEAFQTTFLILVRKAGTLTRPDQLAGWLYGVAYRAALKVRAAAARQAAHGGDSVDVPAPDPEADAGPWDDLRDALDEEMIALPEKFRAPLVLCYLEGMTNEDAARRLGWPAGSMSYRLARGRELLRERLRRRTRHFFAPLPFVLWLSDRAAAASVPAPLAETTAAKAAAERDRNPTRSRFLVPAWGSWGLPAVVAAAVLIVLLLAGRYESFASARGGNPPGGSAPPAQGCHSN
jgi:RNA polymerase sigma factor (sigma-70 family)